MSQIEKALKKTKIKGFGSDDAEPGFAPLGNSILSGDGVAVHIQFKITGLDDIHLEANRIATLLKNDKSSDFYNLLATKVMESTDCKLPCAILVTSAMDGEGKTVTAINLSVSMARVTGKNVFLIDCDLRKPKVCHYLGCTTEKGLSDYLRGDEDITANRISNGKTNLYVISAGEFLLESSDIFNSQKLKKLFQVLKAQHPDSYIICDSPPVILGPETVLISSYADGVVLVVEYGKTTKDEIIEALDLLTGRNIYGVVLNKSEHAPHNYYYYR